MSESKAMKQLHSIREKNLKHLSVKEQIKTIQAEAEPIKKRILDKMRKRELPATGR